MQQPSNNDHSNYYYVKYLKSSLLEYYAVG